LFGDQALILSSCDDVTRFFTTRYENEILEYSDRQPVKEYYDRKKLEIIRDKRRNSMSLSRITPHLDSTNFKFST